MEYAIITTAKNEASYIGKTLESVTTQTLLPVQWIIIDDKSSDNTKQIIQDYCTLHNWITLLTTDDIDISFKTTGGRVPKLFNIALDYIKHNPEFIIKLDADLSFDSSFISDLINKFNENPKLGIASGTLVFDGVVEKVNYQQQSTRGAVMIIKKEILDKTNGLFVSKGRGSDRLLSTAAHYFGWQTFSYPIYFNHLKPEGIKGGNIKNHWIHGFYKGSIPYRFSYFLISQIKHLRKKPYILGSLFQLCGYIFTRWIIIYRPFPPYIKKQVYKEQYEIMRSVFKKIKKNY
ncbi:MAG: glycosyltransferase family 2 protein [Bacteroidia bacterium]|nr:glycosyltransferase family 2 protein [Bacteroidia bacterium]